MTPSNISSLSTLDQIFDKISYLSDPLSYADRDDDEEETLALPGYRQLQSFSCGWVAGLMVLHYFDRRRSPSDFWERLSPHPENGTTTRRLMQGLKQSGVVCTLSKNLTWPKIKKAIQNGNPIILTVKTKRKDELHWVVLYGANYRTKEVFIAGNGIPYLNWLTDAHKLTWGDFYKSWEPKGEALVCRDYSKPRRVR